MSKTFAISLLVLVAATTQANASARSFFQPQMDGIRLAVCANGDASCGKPTADKFCAVQGYKESILFQREFSATQSCTSGQCETFRQIKCYKPDAATSVQASQ
jgi:hypothetical protein